MSNQEKITYKPSFDYAKSYKTEGVAPVQSSDNNASSESPSSGIITKDDILSNIAMVHSASLTIPVELSSIVFSMTSGILSTLKDINQLSEPQDKQDSADNIDTSDIENINNSVSNNSSSISERDKITALPLPLSVSSSAPKKISKIKNDIDYDMVDAFDYTMLLMYNKFLNDLKSHINRYTMSQYLGYKEGQIKSGTDYNTCTTDVNINYQHLADNIVRNEIRYDQQVRLMKKMFSFQNFMSHFNSLYTSKKLYKRYRSEIRQQKNDIISSFINDSLVATRAEYYNKYRSNLTNTYKYFNSCSTLIGEALNMKSNNYLAQNIVAKK